MGSPAGRGCDVHDDGAPLSGLTLAARIQLRWVTPSASSVAGASVRPRIRRFGLVLAGEHARLDEASTRTVTRAGRMRGRERCRSRRRFRPAHHPRRSAPRSIALSASTSIASSTGVAAERCGTRRAGIRHSPASPRGREGEGDLDHLAIDNGPRSPPGVEAARCPPPTPGSSPLRRRRTETAAASGAWTSICFPFTSAGSHTSAVSSPFASWPRCRPPGPRREARRCA